MCIFTPNVPNKSLLRNGLFQKKSKQGVGGLGIYFFGKKTGYFRFFMLSLEISEKTSCHPWKFFKIMTNLLEIPSLKTKTHENSALKIPHDFFLNTPTNSHAIKPGMLEHRTTKHGTLAEQRNILEQWQNNGTPQNTNGTPRNTNRTPT